MTHEPGHPRCNGGSFAKGKSTMTTSQSDATTTAVPLDTTEFLRRITAERVSPYDLWTKSTGLPIHEGYFAEDVRTIDLGWWEERECYAAFLKLKYAYGAQVNEEFEGDLAAHFDAHRDIHDGLSR